MLGSEIVKEVSAYARWFRYRAFEPWGGLKIGRCTRGFHPELGGPIGQVSTLGPSHMSWQDIPAWLSL
jgi:hypothetical protein